jgi:hypothetical protein
MPPSVETDTASWPPAKILLGFGESTTNEWNLHR